MSTSTYFTKTGRILLVLLGMLGFQPIARSQEMFTQGPAKVLSQVGFEQLTGGVVIIKALLNDYPDTLNFIMDTGSGGISLDSTTTATLGLTTVPSDRTIRGIAGIKKVDYTNGHTLHLPGLDVKNLDFHINDYEILTGVYGLKIDGIIGYSFLRRYIVAMNYDDKIMTVYSIGDLKYPRGGTMLRPAISGLPMQFAEMEDAKNITGRFYLDTGAGLNLLLSNDFASDSSLFSSGKKKFPTIAEGLGGKKDMELTTMKRFKLGNFKFLNVPVFLFEDEFNVTAYPHLGGLIGNDILRRFNVIINYSRSEFHLVPNTHFREPFDYSYTGLGLYYTNGTIVVTDVIPKSPAAVAGLQVGDVVIAVGNSFSNSMQIYRTQLQQTGSKIKMVVTRNNELFETTMQVKSIKKKK
ncbi:MAG TPA: aspartyl protease family protein [Phnomibacter sp.]|nr:aspartyl protease family protein [Phnomibacter sp.]